MTPRRLLALLALGALVLAAAVGMARAWLPEWRSASLPEKRFFAERYRELARRAGARLGPGAPRMALTVHDQETGLRRSRLDGLSADSVTALGGGLLVEVRQPAALASGKRQELIVELLPGGEPASLHWGRKLKNVTTKREGGKSPVSPPEQDALARLLVRPGERLGAGGPPRSGRAGITVYPLAGSVPPQRVVASISTDEGTLVLSRELAEEEKGEARTDVAELVLVTLPNVLGVCAALYFFLRLLFQRRIDFINAAAIAAFLLAVSTPVVLAADPNRVGVALVAGSIMVVLWIFVLWSTADSFLRAVRPDAALGLDALRTGRLGPRGGQALLAGLAFGALAAGARLAALALAARLPGVKADDPSLPLPLFTHMSPFSIGVMFAAGAGIAVALTQRLPARWAPWAPWIATLAAGLALPFVTLHPSGWTVAADLPVAALLVLATRRAGLAALLTAGICVWVLPAAVFSALHLAWLPLEFALTAGFPLLLLLLGFVGLRRPEWVERERLRQPAFVRRLEEERRLSYEMDLLARMQRELLPATPEIPGWEIQVASLLATEAGGDLYDFLTDEAGDLWIAAGDVAGHGFSCAIVQAMTSAALTGTIGAGQLPSAALRGVDRVIRRGGARRNFTSLAVVRLDPRTGEALLANAGHPFPLLLAPGGEVEEIDLPGLPLGSGPPRTYADLPFQIPPGGALVLCSDGLFEATDPRGNDYGYERPRDLLRTLAAAGDRSAAEILEALFADWKAYRREQGAPADDTTVLVVKRQAAAEPGTKGTAGTTGT